MLAVRLAAFPACFAANRHDRVRFGIGYRVPKRRHPRHARECGTRFPVPAGASFLAQRNIATARKCSGELDIEFTRLGDDDGIARGFGVLPPQKGLARENKAHDRRCRPFVAHDHLAAPRLRGEVELPIPAASAVKIGGQRAYKLARRGVEVEMPVRRSTVHALEVVAYTGETVTLDLRVSSGTYVRSLAIALGGHCVSLRRTEVGPFSVDDAVGPEAFTPERLLTEAEVLERV